MKTIIIRKLTLEDESAFLYAMKSSAALHDPWMSSPKTSEEFAVFFQRFQQPNQISFLACAEDNDIIGVFNLSEIVRGIFQNAYLGFCVMIDYASQGYMSQALKQILEIAFVELGLHRLEANIQPTNMKSINLVKHNGFRREGYSSRYLQINEVWCDFERWAMTLEDWLEIK